jgi:hypothetical protein
MNVKYFCIANSFSLRSSAVRNVGAFECRELRITVGHVRKEITCRWVENKEFLLICTLH